MKIKAADHMAKKEHVAAHKAIATMKQQMEAAKTAAEKAENAAKKRVEVANAIAEQKVAKAKKEKEEAEQTLEQKKEHFDEVEKLQMKQLFKAKDDKFEALEAAKDAKKQTDALKKELAGMKIKGFDVKKLTGALQNMKKRIKTIKDDGDYLNRNQVQKVQKLKHQISAHQRQDRLKDQLQRVKHKHQIQDAAKPGPVKVKVSATVATPAPHVKAKQAAIKDQQQDQGAKQVVVESKHSDGSDLSLLQDVSSHPAPQPETTLTETKKLQANRYYGDMEEIKPDPFEAFGHFAMEQRDIVKQSRPGISHVELGKLLGDMWGQMSWYQRRSYYDEQGEDLVPHIEDVLDKNN